MFSLLPAYFFLTPVPTEHEVCKLSRKKIHREYLQPSKTSKKADCKRAISRCFSFHFCPCVNPNSKARGVLERVEDDDTHDHQKAANLVDEK